MSINVNYDILQDYFKVSGQHYYRNLPKSDVRVVILVVVALISWFFHTIQNQKYQQLVKYLRHAVLNNLTAKNGGTKQTMELFKRAEDVYNDKIRECKYFALRKHNICNILCFYF